MAGKVDQCLNASRPRGDGFDLEQYVRHGKTGHPEDRLRRRDAATASMYSLPDDAELFEVWLNHIRPELHDMAQVEPVGSKRDTQVVEGLEHLLGKV